MSKEKYHKDLFISYAHIDNQPLSKKQQGWVSQFHKDLEAMVSMKMGKKARIWRDTKLQGNDIFGDEIAAQFPATALFVSVLTPRYLKSEWCTREIEEFCRVVKLNGGLVVANKSRIFKVIKTPVKTQELLPEEVRRVLGYQFYTFDEHERPIDLDPDFGDELEEAYLRKLNALAWDIAQLLEELETNGSVDDDAPRAEDGGGVEALATEHEDALDEDALVIYLAECSRDRQKDREMLALELKKHGHTVLPDHQLPWEEAEYIAEVEGFLARCDLSIHLIGKLYGHELGESEKSTVVLQNEIAARQSERGPLKRLIWLPADAAHSKHPKQQHFVEAIGRDAAVQRGADVLTGSLENLKAAMHAKLEQLEEPEPVSTAPAMTERPKMVYVICIEKDLDDDEGFIRLLTCLTEQGFDVELPPFIDDAAEIVRRANQELLTTCDAVLLYYGAGDVGWRVSMESELRKLPYYRTDNPLPDAAVYTYLGGPATKDKEKMIKLSQFKRVNLIDAVAGFSEAQIAPFARSLTES